METSLENSAALGLDHPRRFQTSGGTLPETRSDVCRTSRLRPRRSLEGIRSSPVDARLRNPGRNATAPEERRLSGHEHVHVNEGGQPRPYRGFLDIFLLEMNSLGD